jgi:DNA-binding GntR family transcriptional regulator
VVYIGGKPVKKDVFILRNIDKFASVTEAIRSREFSYRYQVLENSVLESNRYISKALDIPLASKVFCFEKVRVVEDEPRSIEKVYIDYKKVPGIEKLELSNESFYSILRREYGIEINQSEEEILIVDVNEKERQLLNLKKDSEVLLIKGITYINNHEPFECFEIVSVTDFYKFRSVLNLDD